MMTNRCPKCKSDQLYIERDTDGNSIKCFQCGRIVKYFSAPRIEWVREIVEAADKAGIPVFLKNNLKPILHPEKAGIKLNEFEMRQEFPSERVN